MTALTITDLENGKLDMDHIAAVATSTGATATDRLGHVKQTMQGIVDGLNATAAITTTGSNKIAAQAAQTAAETARDAAFVNAAVYANTAAGLAATTTGQQFQVISGSDIIRYRNDAGPVATEVARYPASALVRTQQSRVIAQGIAYAVDAAGRVVGKASPVSGSGGGAGTYMFTGRPAVAGLISEVKIYAATQAAKLKIYRASAVGGTAYTLAYEVALSLLTGLNTFSVAAGTLGEYMVQDGDVLGFYFPAGIHYASTTGVTGYTAYASTDKTDAATFDNLGEAGTIELQCGITISAASSHDLVKARSVDETLSRTFSLGEKTPVAPASLQYMAVGFWYAWDWEFKSAAMLTGMAISSQSVGVGKIVVLEPYLGGYRVRRSIQVVVAAGVSSLVAGTDFPADLLVPKGGLIAFKNGTTTSIHLNVYDYLARYRIFYGDAVDGIVPSYKWPSGLENLSGVDALSGTLQLRFDFREAVDPALTNTAPQYVAHDKFDQTYGSVVVQGDAWIKGAGKMSSSTTNLADRLEYVGGNPHLTKLTAKFKFQFTAAASAVYIFKRPFDGNQGTLFSIDMTGNALTLYNLFDSSGVLPGVYSTRASTLTFAQNVPYIVTFDKNYKTMTITITDSITGLSDSIVYDGFTIGSTAGFGYGAPGIACKAGTIDLLEFSLYSSRKAPKAMLFGDSITEGTGVTAIANSWAYLVCENGNSLASPRGGDRSSSIARRLQYEIQQFPSVRFALFLMGTNDTDMTVWQRSVDNAAEFCQTYGITPIFGTLPPEAADTNPVLVQNPYIRSSGYRYIDFARALTVGGDGVTRDAAKFYDTLHPNDAGHLAMYNRVRLDVPELFD